MEQLADSLEVKSSSCSPRSLVELVISWSPHRLQRNHPRRQMDFENDTEPML